MMPMDVYLSRQAMQQLEALNVMSAGKEGILSGHKRGQRFFVENILQMEGTLSPSPDSLRPLQDLLQESFLGFFSFDSHESREQREWGPNHMGKVFLEIDSRPDSKPHIRAAVIDFDGTFRLQPITVRKEV
ncbi:hypothetical protein ACFLR7_01520 [Acidobacteriota bacterium]